MTNRRISDERFDLWLAHLLRAGVALSAALVIAGAVIYFVLGSHPEAQFGTFTGEPGDLRSVSGILADARALRGRGIMQLGVLALIATPIVRVAFSVLIFLRERDWLYTTVTLIVLMLLLYGIVNG